MRVRDDTLIKRFAAEYQDYNGISSQRALEQQVILRKLAGTMPLDKPTTDGITEFLTKRMADGRHPNTARKNLMMVRSFYGWAYQQKIIGADLLLDVRSVKPPAGSCSTSPPRPYRRTDVMTFWAALETHFPLQPERAAGWVNRGRHVRRWQRIRPHAMRLQIETIVKIALYCGLRLEEISKLTLRDAHMDNAYIVVRTSGKTKLPRDVPYPNPVRDAVGTWLDFRASLNPTHDSLFLQLWQSSGQRSFEFNDPISVKAMGALLSKVPGCPDGNWELHRFRHTCGTEWLRSKMPLEQVSRLLGHSNLQQTLGYAQIVRDDIHETVAANEAAFTRAVGMPVA